MATGRVSNETSDAVVVNWNANIQEAGTPGVEMPATDKLNKAKSPKPTTSKASAIVADD
jgi:hypothetical protein